MPEKNDYYNEITETPKIRGTVDQINRSYSRYRFASNFCHNKNVLEIGCGAGIGTGYLARKAKKIAGVDISPKNIKLAKNLKIKNASFFVADVDKHSFGQKKYNVIICYQTIFYLKNPEDFIKKTKKHLSKNGVLIINLFNKKSPGFNPSAYSIKYFSSTELYDLLKNNGFSKIKILAANQVSNNLEAKIKRVLIKIALIFHLIPKGMKAKEILKKIFGGGTNFFPKEFNDQNFIYQQPRLINSKIEDKVHKDIYAVAKNI